MGGGGLVCQVRGVCVKGVSKREGVGLRGWASDEFVFLSHLLSLSTSYSFF